MKYTELSDKEKNAAIRGQFMHLVDCIFTSDDLKKELPEEDYVKVKEFAKELSIKCSCGECTLISMYDGKIPEELYPVIDLAKKRAEAHSY